MSSFVGFKQVMSGKKVSLVSINTGLIDLLSFWL